jgi:general secretion pathway protein F
MSRQLPRNAHVLPQFAGFFRESHAKLDPIVSFFLNLSDFIRAHGNIVAAGLAVALTTIWLLARRADVQRATWNALRRLPLARSLLMYYATGLFCRNLGLLLASGLTISATPRILVEIMSRRGEPEAWISGLPIAFARRQAVRCTGRAGSSIDGGADAKIR